jgi:hypothetical protein
MEHGPVLISKSRRLGKQIMDMIAKASLAEAQLAPLETTYT